MESLSVTIRHYYINSFLHQAQLIHNLNLKNSYYPPVFSSLNINHASFDAIPVSISLGPPSSSSSSRVLSSSGSSRFFKELNECKNLGSVKATHARMMRSFKRGDSDSIFKALISCYLEFGDFRCASIVFLLGFAGNHIIWRYFLQEMEKFGGEKHWVLVVFVELQNKGVTFDGRVLSIVLRICAVLRDCSSLGNTIHGNLIKRGLESDTHLVSALISFYGRCVSLEMSNKVFDEMSERDDHVWNEAVMVNLRNGTARKAIDLFREMQFSSAQVSVSTIVKVLQSCSNNDALPEGKQIHGHTVRIGFESNLSVFNSLIVMYSRNNKLESAKKVFSLMKDRNLSSWNSMISGYTTLGCMDVATSLLNQMERCGLKPDIVTFNSLLTGYAIEGSQREAIAIVKTMQTSGFRPNASSISSTLQTIAEPGLIKVGKEIHGYVVRNNLQHDSYVETSLIDMYVKNDSLPYAQRVFDTMVGDKNIVAWNSLISGFSYKGIFKDAEILMEQMDKNGTKPDLVTWNAMVSGYSIWGRIDEALAVIEKMKNSGFTPNVVSWTALISGCSQNGNFKNALEIFIRMQEDGVCPNSSTISSLLRTLGGLNLLQSGREVHSFCFKNGLINNVYVATALVDMYTKSGDLRSASEVFWTIENKTLASWNCMIMGFAMFGQGREGIELFNEMVETGVEPDSITFTSVLCCCKNSGLAHEGWKFFDLMLSDYGIEPAVEHCSCMVDLLGKSGYLDEAWDFIRTMPLKPDATIWGALLSSCRIHRNIELAEIAWKRLQELEPHNSANYMMMMNLHATLKRWKDVEQLRDLMKSLAVRVPDVWSWIQIDQRVHVFYAEGESHPDEGIIYFELYRLICEMKESGYVADTSCVNQNISESEKETLLLRHTEKLAMIYGLIKKKGSVPIRVIKKTRVCSDCHTAAKYMSVLRKREIHLFDGARVHCFRDGKCSCNDSW